MTGTQTAGFAIVREVPNTYDNCIRPGLDRIDVDLAKKQHENYTGVLRELGLEVIKIKADYRFPDCCFVEDTAIIAGETAIITSMGAEARKLETTAVKETLSQYKKVKKILPPACIDGGDVLKIGDKIYIGLSTRTNRYALEQLEQLIPYETGHKIIPVELKDTLHLKTACTCLGGDCIVVARGHFDETVFSEYRRIIVPEQEAYSANCLAVNGKVLIPEGYPRTRELIENKGFETVPLDISEFRKGNGGLTCLSVIF